MIEDFIAVDTETTGLSWKTNRLIEIGALHYHNGEECDEFSSLINPRAPISATITRLTGIDSAMVAEAPDLFDVLRPFLRFIGGYPLVFHNAPFDMGFLRAAVKRLNRVEDERFAINNRIYDTVHLTRKKYPKKTTPGLENHRLSTLAEYFRIDNKNAHRALNDCRVAAELFLLCQPEG